MLTTLTTRLLTSPTLKYTYFNKKLTLIIEATGHNIFGDVIINIANAVDVDVYKTPGVLFADIYNQPYLFKSVSANRLEVSLSLDSGLDEAISETTVANNGGAITTTVNNTEVTIPKGEYLFKLIDDAASVFDSALVVIQEQAIYDNGVESYNGISDEFDELGDTTTYDSIDAQELTFLRDVVLSVGSIGASTNIAIFYTELKNVY